MKLGVRGQFFFVSLFLILGAVLLSGVYLERRLRVFCEATIEEALLRMAHVARDWVEAAPGLTDLASAESLADRLGDSSGARITIIRLDGVVLGDSKLDVIDAPPDNHGSRPEVREAILRGRGRARRYSSTLHTEMLYVALRFNRQDNRGVLRVARSLVDVEASVAHLRKFLFVAGAFGFLVAALMSGFASHLWSRRVRALVHHARSLARGENVPRPLVISTQDEFGGLAGSFNKIAAALDRTVADLANERNRLQTVLEGMTESVLALDAERRITLMNQAAMKLLGVAGPPENRSLLDAVRVPALVELVSASQGGETQSREFDLPGPVPRRVLAHAAPLTEAKGSLVVMHDVTEVRRLEAVRRDFVANVSHELRTPVSVVQANAETLLAGAIHDKEGRLAFVEAIQRSAARLADLVSDLLDLSQIEAGKTAIERTPLGLFLVVKKAVGLISTRAEAKRIEIRYDIADDVSVLADRQALDQVLVNLLDNAVKYTPADGVVEIVATQESTHVLVEISDDGPGIAKKHAERIFERFYRVDPGRSRALGGTGLGLSIVKHLVEAMEGTVGYRARERGSIFWFRLCRR